MEFVADLLYDLPKDYPLVFDIIHYVVCLQAERLDMGDKFAETTQNNPLVRHFLRCFSISIHNLYFFCLMSEI
jgi:hypothetical protein